MYRESKYLEPEAVSLVERSIMSLFLSQRVPYRRFYYTYALDLCAHPDALYVAWMNYCN